MSPEQFSPARLFLTLLLLIFCIEGALMLGLHYVFPAGITVWAEALIDAVLLTVISSLFIWRLLMHPLALALGSEAARARAVMDNAAEGIVTIDERGIIESFNRAAEQMFGYEAGEAIGKNVKILVPEPHASAHDGYIARYLSTGEAHVIGRPRELSALRKEGSEFPIELNVRDIRFGGERCFTAIIRDITERKRAEERIQHLAHFDSLTGLPNRALFYDRLGQAIGLARRERYEVALMYIDLDRFKAVNDTLGHDAGDELLRAVADRIRARLRETDTVARIGGDEFIVILPRMASSEDIGAIARKLLEGLRAPYRLGSAGQETSIGASIGIAIYPNDADEGDALLKAADAAMYEAKQTRNDFRFHRRAQPQQEIREKIGSDSEVSPRIIARREAAAAGQ